MSHFTETPPTAARPWAVALATTMVLALAGCGGDDGIVAVTPPPPTGPTTTTDPSIAAAQASLDGTALPALAANGVPGDALITARQKALDGATTDGPGIDSNQAAMDANGEQPYKLTALD